LWPVLILVAGPILIYGYLALFVTLARTDAWRHRLQPLAAAGRMALSNYISQSIICTLIFYSYGLGLFGQVGAFAGLLISIVIWVVQLGISLLWLRHF
jgi:Predicted membrane protein